MSQPRHTDLTCPASPAHVVPAGKVLKFPLWRPHEAQSPEFQAGQGREEPTLGTSRMESLPIPRSCRMEQQEQSPGHFLGGLGCSISIPSLKDFFGRSCGAGSWRGVVVSARFEQSIPCSNLPRSLSARLSEEVPLMQQLPRLGAGGREEGMCQQRAEFHSPHLSPCFRSR